MSQDLELLAREQVVTIRDIQKNPSRVLQGITRIIRNGNTIGFFFSQVELEDLLENAEGKLSTAFKKKIQQGKKEIAQGKTISLQTLKKQYGL